MKYLTEMSQTETVRAVFYTYQTYRLCCGLCAYDCTHQMASTGQ